MPEMKAWQVYRTDSQTYSVTVLAETEDEALERAKEETSEGSYSGLFESSFRVYPLDRTAPEATEAKGNETATAIPDNLSAS